MHQLQAAGVHCRTERKDGNSLIHRAWLVPWCLLPALAAGVLPLSLGGGQSVLGGPRHPDCSQTLSLLTFDVPCFLIHSFLAGCAAAPEPGHAPMYVRNVFSFLPLLQVVRLLQSLGVADHLPARRSPGGAQLYSFWQRHAWLTYCMYGISAAFLLAVLLAAPLVLYLHTFKRMQCDA